MNLRKKCFLSIIFIFSLCITTQQIFAAEQWKTYHESGGDFSIDIPASWKYLNKSEFPSPYFRMFSGSDNLIVIAISRVKIHSKINSISELTSTELETYIATFSKNAAKENPYCEYKNHKRIKIGKVNAIAFYLLDTSNGYNNYMLDLNFIRNGYNYEILYMVPEIYYDSQRQMIRDSISSINFY